jgi:hypothetical protein
MVPVTFGKKIKKTHPYAEIRKIFSKSGIASPTLAKY